MGGVGVEVGMEEDQTGTHESEYRPFLEKF